jgi:hypothetical protein
VIKVPFVVGADDQIYAAVRALGPPDGSICLDESNTTSAAAETATATTTTPAQPTTMQRVRKNKIVSGIACAVATLTVYALMLFIVGYAIPRFTSRMFLDCFWGTFCMLLMTLVLFTVGLNVGWAVGCS